MGNPAKKLLRERIKSLVKSLTMEQKQRQSEIIFQKLLNTPEYKAAKRVSIFLSTIDEVNTLPILFDMFHCNKRVFVPTYNKNIMEMVEIHNIEDYNNLPMTKWNIRQPNLDENRENAINVGLDLILMPGVAFDKQNCGRCGHGMGYYDKYLTRLFEKYPRNSIKLFGLAFEEQLVDTLPLEDHDVPLDSIISP